MLLLLIVFPVGGYLILQIRQVKTRDILFAAFNVLLASVACQTAVYISHPQLVGKVALGLFLVYLGMVLASYVVLKITPIDKPSGIAAILVPVLALLLFKLLPVIASLPHLKALGSGGIALYFVGISYLCFRLAHLAQEVRNGVVEMPPLENYLSFAFFLPTMWVGPISPYSYFAASLGKFDRDEMPVDRCLMRILVGLTKTRFLSPIVGQLTYSGLLMDGHPHRVIDLVIAILVYPVFLFLNFSGFCDIAIGVGGLLGIRVMENFDRPFASRNFQEFWTRWHISLSGWFRDLVFVPMSKTLVRRVGTARANHAIAASIITIFILLGLWHGLTLNFVLYGLTQGVGVAVVFYWSNYLRRRLGRKPYEEMRNKGWVLATSRVATYLYLALTLILFANSKGDMAAIMHSLRTPGVVAVGGPVAIKSE